MYLTQQTDYALRILIYVATHNGHLVQIATIARDYKISKSHLMKVTSALVKHGFLIGMRGKNGGLKLARDAQEIVIGAVVRAIEPMFMVECFRENDQCLLSGCCTLSGIIDGAAQAFLAHLDQYTLADALNQKIVHTLHFVRTQNAGKTHAA